MDTKATTTAPLAASGPEAGTPGPLASSSPEFLARVGLTLEEAQALDEEDRQMREARQREDEELSQMQQEVDQAFREMPPERLEQFLMGLTARK